MAEDGVAGANAALSLLSNPERLLSVVQVGVTLASLGLGWAGEETVHGMLIHVFHPAMTPATEKLWHGVSFAVSFLLISYFHVVVGEVVPKNLAIAKADRLAILVAPALLVFYRLSLPFVVTIERSSALVTRLLGLKLGAHGGGHSAEELKLIVSSSRGYGYLPEAQEDMIHRVLDLGSILVREIMVPRRDIVSVPSNATLDQVLRSMIDSQHSRIPVYDGATERVIGFVHYKDLLPLWEERRRSIQAGRPARSFQLSRLLRRHLVVPETKHVSQMMEEFRRGHSHLAMVVDEYGTIIGMLTVEDVLEQIVGRIEDEHDEKSTPRSETDEIELDGATRLRDLEGEFGIELPTDGSFETLAGFLLFRLGEIPRTGRSLDYEGRRFTVLEMDRNRVAKVRIEKLPEQPAAAPG
jgi:CBS domain containing-hemolysin-like protein